MSVDKHMDYGVEKELERLNSITSPPLRSPLPDGAVCRAVGIYKYRSHEVA